MGSSRVGPLTIAYVVDPRFPGGTSGAVAAELRAIAGLGPIRVHALETAMFAGRRVAPALQAALDALGLDLDWDSPVIAADLVVFHNPVSVKFQADLGRRIITRDLVVVMHANPLSPAGTEAFAVGDCLRRIAGATTALRRWIAPISPVSRASCAGWAATRPDAMARWRMLGWDWTNICEGGAEAPARQPADRRGRHSRPGLEKFPDLATLDICFPAHAHANLILGGDNLGEPARLRPHWDVRGFGTLALSEYFGRIDFMVYFTSPFFSESFGRVLAEAILAGKVVISDPRTAGTFGDGVIAAMPAEVDAIIAAHVADPARFARQVRVGQEEVSRFSARAFSDRFHAFCQHPEGEGMTA